MHNWGSNSDVVILFGHVCFRSPKSAPIFDPVCHQPNVAKLAHVFLDTCSDSNGNNKLHADTEVFASCNVGTLDDNSSRPTRVYTRPASAAYLPPRWCGQDRHSAGIRRHLPWLRRDCCQQPWSPASLRCHARSYLLTYLLTYLLKVKVLRVLPRRRFSYRQSRRSAWSTAQARGHGLWPVAVQPNVTLFRFMVSTSLIRVIRWISAHLPTGEDGGLGWV